MAELKGIEFKGKQLLCIFKFLEVQPRGSEELLVTYLILCKKFLFWQEGFLSALLTLFILFPVFAFIF